VGSGGDGRQSLLSLTARGQQALGPLNTGAYDEVSAMLLRLTASDWDRRIGAMDTTETLLGAQPGPKVPYRLRPHRPGEVGWVVHGHGVSYAQEYGWGETFEARVALGLWLAHRERQTP